MPSDDYLIQTFDPLAPARFVDASLLDTGKPTDTEDNDDDLMTGSKAKKVGKGP